MLPFRLPPETPRHCHTGQSRPSEPLRAKVGCLEQLFRHHPPDLPSWTDLAGPLREPGLLPMFYLRYMLRIHGGVVARCVGLAFVCLLFYSFVWGERGGRSCCNYFMRIRWFLESLTKGCFRWSPGYHPDTAKQRHVSLSKNSACFVGTNSSQLQEK